jgi:hypothetical protein
MFKTKRVAFIVLLSVSISANAQMTSQNTIGNLVGGLIGGAVGSKVGQGNGRTAAIIGGTMLGNYVGDRMTSRQPDTTHQVNQQTYQQPVRQTTRTVMNSSQAADSYANNELIQYEEPRRQRVTRPEREVNVRPRFEKYFYTVQGESGRPIKMVGCASYDDREQASRPVDLRNCDTQQISYVND